MKLFAFKGGVHPRAHKSAAAQLPIVTAPMAARLYVPLHQNIGGAARPLVKPGDKVLKGQCIGKADGWISAAVHAPTSGAVLELKEHPATHPSGLSVYTVVIEPDGSERWIERRPVHYQHLEPETVRQALRDAGIVGLGGAAFPSHAKLAADANVPLETLIINGAECEPFISCDDKLMQERAREIVQGAHVFQTLLEARQVVFGIEDNKPHAISAMQAAVAGLGFPYEVVGVPTIYPAGGAKQLIRLLTGKQTPASKLPTELGVQCFNVATTWSAWRAVARGEPVISRIVTLTGNVKNPRNWEVPIGTPIDEMLKFAQPHADTDGVIVGGPMMGFRLPEWHSPVSKASNCLIATSPKLFSPPPPESPCIRCGECARACPHELQPFELYWHCRAKQFGRAQEYFIFDCIECGCCAYVCPSNIPLVSYFRYGKSEIRERERARRVADEAKERFEFRQFREARDKSEKAERLAKAAARQTEKRKAGLNDNAGQAPDAPEVTDAAAANQAPRA